jgi:hypothetical protein
VSRQVTAIVQELVVACGIIFGRVLELAASLGYTATTPWSGSLSDSTVIAEDYIIRMAEQNFTAQAIVLGHLNHLPVTHVYGQMRDLIRARSLRTVTLNDVFFRPARHCASMHSVPRR